MHNNLIQITAHKFSSFEFMVLQGAEFLCLLSFFPNIMFECKILQQTKDLYSTVVISGCLRESTRAEKTYMIHSSSTFAFSIKGLPEPNMLNTYFQ